jgi:hypothetical protein
VLAQAAGFAFLAALSPTVLLITAVYLGSAEPRRTLLAFLTGALVMTTAMGIAVLLVLRAAHLNHLGQHAPRDGLRLGLGLLLLAAGAVVARRKPRPPDPGRPGKGLMSRLVADPAPLTAAAAGLLVFTPALTFIAAVQVIATARTGTGLTVFGLALVITIDLAFVWLPFLAYLAFPDPTARRLGAFSAWLRAHGHALLAGGMAVAGVILAVDGLAGLIRRG